MLRLESDNRSQGTSRMVLVCYEIENRSGRLRDKRDSTAQNRAREFARNKIYVWTGKLQLPMHVSVHRIAVVVDVCLTVATANVEKTRPWLHVSTVGNSSFTAQVRPRS